MATKPSAPSEFTGYAAQLAGVPVSAVAGTTDQRMGMTDGGMKQQPSFDENGVDEFAGLGPWLEMSDAQVYRQMDGLVLRQELIALNHLAMDTHWTYVKLGYPWSTLTKVPNRDIYQQTLPYGTSGITIQAVPNKVWDLVNKTTETLMVDFPQVECEPIDDTEQARAACEMANRFLSIDGGEQGTNDAVLFHDRVARALTTASAYLECWTDRTGGGYVPLKIVAHPQATDPNNPLIGPDGMPTSENIERYVAGEVVSAEGGAVQFAPGARFTDNAAEAAPQWQPKIRATCWGREHLRVFPESATVDNAEKLIILGFMTVGELKKRCPMVAQMTPGDINALCDWTPSRYLPLLPPFQRARWQLTDGRDKEKSGSSDERIVFYYHGLARACPDYPRGADVFVSGAQGGIILSKDTNSVEVQVDRGQGKTTELRCLEIPVAQVTPRGDPDERDPSGRAYVEMFAGAAEHNAFMAMSFATAVDKNLHMPYAVSSMSAVDSVTFQNAIDSGGNELVPVTTMNEMPQQMIGPKMPGEFFNMYELSDEAINSIAVAERASSGQENSKERSGKALQIAVERNNIGLTGMNTAVNNSYARWGRLKIERCMKDFTSTQQVAYVGDDGAYKQDEWTGVDFALIGKVVVKSGTGTLMGPDQKVQYLGNLQAAQLLPPDEAQEAARSSYSARLGLSASASEQRVERAIEAWMDGPPEGWMPPAPQVDSMTGQPAINPQTMQPVMGAPSWNPFQPRPNDTEPKIAQLWTRKLSEAMSTAKYESFPPEWRALGDQQYMAARQAAAMASAGQQAPQAAPNRQPEKPEQDAQGNAKLPNPRGAAA